MKKIFYLIFAISSLLRSQEINSEYNLDFEKLTLEGMPQDWFEWGSLSCAVDTVNKISGRYSISITSTDKTKFGSVAYSLPTYLKGKEITLEGFIKTKNVIGQVGLLLRIDKNNDAIEFDNMSLSPVTGTTDWKKYKITKPLHNGADAVYVGGIISGTGKVWFDNFNVLIDGESILDYSEKVLSLNNPDNDTRFSNGSNFYLDSPSKKQIDNLEKLGILWGFLKYKSPYVAQGNYNFDYELLEKLAFIDNDSFEYDLEKWKESLMNTPPYLGSHYYLDFMKFSLNPIFENEVVFPNMKFNDDGLKLIALFRYWACIEYLFPYKDMTDSGWKGILSKYIPKFLAADDELSYKLLLIELFKETGDSHAALYDLGKCIDEYFGLYEAPIEIKFIENQVVVSNFRGVDGVKLGDEVIAFDNEDIINRIARIKKYTIASNGASENRDVLRKLLCTNKDNVIIRFKRKNEIYEVKVKTGSIKYFVDNKPSHMELAEDVGYIYPASLKRNEITEIIKKYKNKKGLIFDFRCYPSDNIVYTASELLLPARKEFAQFTATDLQNLGQFRFKNTASTGHENPDYYKGKVVVLIDEQTQSNAEFTVMAFQVIPNVKIIGSQTAGADGDVSKIILPGNIYTMMSGIGVYYPNYGPTQRIGIIPDIKVFPTKKGIMQNKDEILERALLYIKYNN
ncbi:hypothetical protein HYN56_16480 [Flavobacterium crocinum]|uniref:Tail specific protease domain-containing protein n=1 Tax=Flavobacterium crocinum TaxID=2183896 RepID=A0A2S1YNX5_9FLAO|nr:S41 family peptidase [Flavobacterium crocinum]AWK05746.1 hypothetical protein HYN56_16480 [Flavobacterium crocinum]